MREILFKAKHKNWRDLPKEKWWVEGSYHHQTDYYGESCDKHYIIDGTETDMEGYGEHYEIDLETLCQCTGLKDRKGNEIWENDILQNKGHGNPLIVKWNTLYGRYDTVLPSYRPYDPIIASFSLGKWEPLVVDHSSAKLKEYKLANDYEVVGNIFDNREIVYDDYEYQFESGMMITDLEIGKHYLLEELEGNPERLKEVYVKSARNTPLGVIYSLHFVEADSTLDVSPGIWKHMVFHDMEYKL